MEKSPRHEFPHCHPGRYRQHLGVTKVVQGLHGGVTLCLERSRWPGMLGPDLSHHHLNIPSHRECHEYSGRQIADLLCPDHEIVPTNLSANYLSTN